MDYQEEFKKALLSKPHVTLGKKGITDELINHIVNLLKKYKIIKIKLLKSAVHQLSIEEISNQISKSTNSHILDVRGKKIIISKFPIEKITKKNASK